jgi:hypothetical protein
MDGGGRRAPGWALLTWWTAAAGGRPGGFFLPEEAACAMEGGFFIPNEPACAMEGFFLDPHERNVPAAPQSMARPTKTKPRLRVGHWTTWEYRMIKSRASIPGESCGIWVAYDN